MEVITHLPLKNSLLKHALFFYLKKTIIEKLNSTIPEIKKIRMNHELTEITSNLIENLSNSDNIDDKKALALEILNTIFGYTPEETEIIKQQIQYTYENDMIIKIPTFKKYYGYLKEWIKRKFL